jgi:hypothetical protein
MRSVCRLTTLALTIEQATKARQAPRYLPTLPAAGA